MKNCYIHIPFCNKICSYCDFCKLYYNKDLVNKYLDTLEKEINKIYKGEVLETIYIGGGTPSSLSLDELERLFKILSVLNKDKKIEYTIENNFDSITEEKINLYKKYGINRLSFGIETTNNSYLKLLNRSLSKDKVRKIINYSKEIGIININVDLIYALPNESINDLEKDIDFILSLDIPHISTYSLIIEDNTILKINNYKNISEDLDSDMYKYICKRLKDNNFTHYEISNFSKEGYYSKHNLCYWNNKEYYGFGLGSSSYINNKRITNTRSITNYLKEDFIKEEEIIDINSKIEYEVILNLRKKEGIDLISFKDKYKKDLLTIYNYNELVDKEFLILNNNHLYIPEDKWYISNEIIVRLLNNR